MNRSPSIKKAARATALLCAVFLTAAAMGCSGGLVYRPEPEPKYDLPKDISIEQDIYAATARPTPKPQPPSADRPKEQPPSRPVADTAADNSLATPASQDTICIRPNGSTYSFFAGIGEKKGFYSLHRASFRRFDFAMIEAKKIARQTGQMTFVRRAELPGSGIWYRLYFGMFPTESAAQALGVKMKSDGALDYFCVYKLSAPLAAE